MFKLFIGSIMGKVMLALLASLLAVATIQTLRVSWGQAREIKLSEALRTSEANLAIANKTTKANAVATTTQQAVKARVEQEATHAAKDLDIALESSPDWAAQPIPDDIARSLRGTD